MAGTIYTSETLFSTLNGQLVLAMVALWLALTALVEIGAKRFESGLNGKKLREPAHRALPIFQAATVVAIGLLVVAGLITTNVGRLF